MQDDLLVVNHLTTEFFNENSILKAVDDVSFYVKKGEILGIVGESGCGKSVTAMSILCLIPETQGKVSDGEILFEGQDLLKLPKKEFQKIAGKDISMIFQEPLSSLNPLLTCGFQVSEQLMFHLQMDKKSAEKRSVELFELVGIPYPEKRVKEFPHQLSGGMRQRVMIAMAIACNPKLLIADEPTTALDVTIQAQIVQILKGLQKESGMSVIFITHDLGLIADVADRVMVMYAGNIVEIADVKDFFHEQKHPYTEGLLKALPLPHSKRKRLFVIEGTVPDLTQTIQGCIFYDRCYCRQERCKKAKPTLVDLGNNRYVACWLRNK